MSLEVSFYKREGFINQTSVDLKINKPKKNKESFELIKTANFSDMFLYKVNSIYSKEIEFNNYQVLPPKYLFTLYSHLVKEDKSKIDDLLKFKFNSNTLLFKIS